MPEPTDSTESDIGLVRMWRISLIASLLIYAFLQVLWITVTPLSQVEIAGRLPDGRSATMLVGTGPDETEHYLYILSIAETGRIPRPNPAMRRSPADFISHEAQHPPLYYLCAAAIRNLVQPMGDVAVWYTLRAVGAVLGAIAIWLISRAALIAFPNRPLIAVATPPVLAMLPMYDYMTSELSNFPLELVFTSCGWLILVTVIRGRRPLNLESGVLLALWFGLAAMTRQTSSMWMPAVAIVLFYVIKQAKSANRGQALAGLAAFALVYAAFALPWYVYMKDSYGAFLFRSDFRPMLAHISLGAYLANSTQPLVVPNMPHAVHCSALDTVLWYVTTGWIPYWIAQFGIPAWFGTPEAFQSIFLIIDGAVLLLLFRHWSVNRHSDTPERDPAGQVLLWACACSIAVTVLLVLQQQFLVDIEMFLYYGRYGLSVVAASSLLLLFALSTLTGRSTRGVVAGAVVVALVMLLFNGWTYSLIHGFYLSQSTHP